MNVFLMYHTDIQILKTFQKTNLIIHKKIVIFDNNERVFGLNCWLLPNSGMLEKPHLLRKLEFMICMKMQNCALFWKWYEFLLKLNDLQVSNRSDFRKEINNNICWCRHALKHVGNSFFFYRHLHSSQEEFQKCWS